MVCVSKALVLGLWLVGGSSGCGQPAFPKHLFALGAEGADYPIMLSETTAHQRGKRHEGRRELPVVHSRRNHRHRDPALPLESELSASTKLAAKRRADKSVQIDSLTLSATDFAGYSAKRPSAHWSSTLRPTDDRSGEQAAPCEHTDGWTLGLTGATVIVLANTMDDGDTGVGDTLTGVAVGMLGIGVASYLPSYLASDPAAWHVHVRGEVVKQTSKPAPSNTAQTEPAEVSYVIPVQNAGSGTALIPAPGFRPLVMARTTKRGHLAHQSRVASWQHQGRYVCHETSRRGSGNTMPLS